MIALAFAAMTFVACGGNKNAQNAEEAQEEKSFEQEQIEASIKMHLDSIASEVSRLKPLPFLVEGQDKLVLTDEEKQVTPDYLLDAAVADDAATLSEKYRVLSALNIDKKVATLYSLPTEDYDKAIAKLAADINDPSFSAVEDPAAIFETPKPLYEAMNENGRINYFWQLASAALIEQLYVVSQNTEKFLSVVDDEAASNITFRIVVILDAVNRLSEYDEEIKPVAESLATLEVLNAVTVDELKGQLESAAKDIAAARANLVK